MGDNMDDIKTKIANATESVTGSIGELSATAVHSVTQAQARVTDIAGDTQARVADALDAAASRVKSAQDGAREKLPSINEVRQNNPLLLLLGVAAAAFAAGYFIPLSELEKERFTPIGDNLARRAAEARDEVLSQSSAVVSETLAAAKSSLKTHGEETADFLGLTDVASAKPETSNE